MTAHPAPTRTPGPQAGGLCCKAEVTVLSLKRAESGESKGRAATHTTGNGDYSDTGEDG